MKNEKQNNSIKNRKIKPKKLVINIKWKNKIKN